MGIAVYGRPTAVTKYTVGTIFELHLARMLASIRSFLSGMCRCALYDRQHILQFHLSDIETNACVLATHMCVLVVCSCGGCIARFLKKGTT